MITKIISGGQTGADRATLDVAIEHGIPHGGWIPKGRKTEAGRLSSKYQLKEMPTADYPKRTEKNVIDSDGTLIISHGELTGGSDYTREMAQKHGRPSLHIDLGVINGFKAAQIMTTWIADQGIKILNVAGPRASKDHKIYDVVRQLLTAVLRLDQVQRHMPALESFHLPRKVDEAVDFLMSNLPVKDKTMIAKMPEDDLHYLHNTLGQYIRNNFGLWAENRSLIQSCHVLSRKNLSEDECSAFILKELWVRLQSSHRLRAVK